jgi:hypothetical protein
LDETRFPEKKAEMIDAVELCSQCFIGIDCKVGGHEGQIRIGADLVAQETANLAPVVIVPDT